MILSFQRYDNALIHRLSCSCCVQWQKIIWLNSSFQCESVWDNCILLLQYFFLWLQTFDIFHAATFQIGPHSSNSFVDFGIPGVKNLTLLKHRGFEDFWMTRISILLPTSFPVFMFSFEIMLWSYVQLWKSCSVLFELSFIDYTFVK